MGVEAKPNFTDKLGSLIAKVIAQRKRVTQMSANDPLKLTEKQILRALEMQLAEELTAKKDTEDDGTPS